MEYRNKPKIPLLPKKAAINGSTGKLQPWIPSKQPEKSTDHSNGVVITSPREKNEVGTTQRPKPPLKPRPLSQALSPVPTRPPPLLPVTMRVKAPDSKPHASCRNTFSPEDFKAINILDNSALDKNGNRPSMEYASKTFSRPLQPRQPRPISSNLNKLKSTSAPNLFTANLNRPFRPHAKSTIVEDVIYEQDQCDDSDKVQRFRQLPIKNLKPNNWKNLAKTGFKKGRRKWHSFAEHVASHQESFDLEDISEVPRTEIKEPVRSYRYSELHTDIDTPLFERVLVVTLVDKSGKLVPEISFQFPPNFDDRKLDQKMLAIPQFCFPDTSLSYKHGETFSFVLTSDSGQRRYGFCRMINSEGMLQPEVYCIISPYGLFGLYSQILEEVENQRRYSSTAVFSLLKTTLSNPLPQPEQSTNISFFTSGSSSARRSITLTRPGDSSIHEHVKMKLLFDTLKTDIILQLLSCLLTETKVILCSDSLSLLTSCCHTLISLMYPFDWEHTYIPVLPTSLVDIVCLPTPYLLGVLPSCLPEIEDLPIEEVYIVNLDTGEDIVKPELKCIIPKYLCGAVTNALEQVFDVSSCSDVEEKLAQNEIICKIFIEIYIQLIGHFERFYTKDEDGIDVIDYRPFYKASRTKEQKVFLKVFTLTQAFQKFATSRKSNDGPSHVLFETCFEAWKKDSHDDQSRHWKRSVDSMLVAFKSKFKK